MVCWRFFSSLVRKAGGSFSCILLLSFLVFSACSDDSSSSSKSEQDVPANDSTAADSVTLRFVGGPVMFTEIDPINIVYEDHEGGDAG